MGRKLSRNVWKTRSSNRQNAPSEDRKCWQRVELGVHVLNRWTVKCLELSRKLGVQTDKTPRARTEVLAALPPHAPRLMPHASCPNHWPPTTDYWPLFSCH